MSLQDIGKKIASGDLRVYLKHSLSRDQVKTRLNLWKLWGASDGDRFSRSGCWQALHHRFFILDRKVNDPASQTEKLGVAFERIERVLYHHFASSLPVNSDPDNVERFEIVIGTITLGQNPVPIEPLTRLTGLKLEAVYGVVDNLQPVISFSNRREIPHVYHNLFLDYITDTTRCTDEDLCIIPKAIIPELPGVVSRS